MGWSGVGSIRMACNLSWSRIKLDIKRLNMQIVICNIMLGGKRERQGTYGRWDSMPNHYFNHWCPKLWIFTGLVISMFTTIGTTFDGQEILCYSFCGRKGQAPFRQQQIQHVYQCRMVSTNFIGSIKWGLKNHQTVCSTSLPIKFKLQWTCNRQQRSLFYSKMFIYIDSIWSFTLHHKGQWLDHRIHLGREVSLVEHLTEGKMESHMHFVYCSHIPGSFWCLLLLLDSCHLHTCKEPI